MKEFLLTEEDVRLSASHYDIPGDIVDVEECHNGHINRTYFLTYEHEGVRRRYVMQMVNTDIFKKPDEVMENIVNVTRHIRNGLIAKGIDPERRTLNVIWTKSGNWGHIDRRGIYWRMYDFVEDSDCFMKVESAEMFEKVGYSFGQFQRQLADFDASVLHESIPNFHNTEWRFANLEKAIAENKSGRAHLVADEIKFALDRKDITLIRPLVYAPEKDIKYFINHSDLPIVESPCPMDKTSDRENVKKLLADLEKDSKGLKYRIFGAMQRADIDGFMPEGAEIIKE